MARDSSAEKPDSGGDSSAFAVGMHLLPLVPGWGVLLSIALWLIGRGDRPGLDPHMRTIGNLLITFFLANIAMGTLFVLTGLLNFGVLMPNLMIANPFAFFTALSTMIIPLVGFLLLGIGMMILLVIGAFHASQGVVYQYPLTFPFLGR